MSDKPLKDAGQESAAQQIAKILASVGGQRPAVRSAIHLRACGLVRDMPLCTCGGPAEKSAPQFDAVRLACVDWRAGDRLLLTFKGVLSSEQREALRRQVRDAFPDMPADGILVLDGGIGLSVVHNKPKETPAPRFKVGDYVHYVSDNSAVFRVAVVVHDDPLPYRIERATNKDSAGTSWAWTFDAAIKPLTHAELIAHKLPPYGPNARFYTRVHTAGSPYADHCAYCGDLIFWADVRGAACACDGARKHGEPVAP